MRHAIVLVMMLILPAPGRAQAPTAEQRAEAKAHYEQATRYFDVGRFAEAVTEFQKTFELTGSPEVLFNIAQTWRAARKYENALRTYRTYLRRLPEAPNRDEVERYIEQMRVAAEQERQTQAPPPVPLPTALAPPLTPTAPLPHPDDPRRRLRLRASGYAVGAVGVAALVAGVVLAALSQSTQGKLESDSRQGQTFSTALQRLYSTGQSESTASIACFASGGTMAVTATALLIAGAHRGGRRSRALIVPVVAPRAGGIALAGSF